jgi:hypothetical protein
MSRDLNGPGEKKPSRELRWVDRIRLYWNTYISFVIPDNSAKLSWNNLYESRDLSTGMLFIPDFFLSCPYKIFASSITSFTVTVSIEYLALVGY